eukprot:jgi/Botrbrau1/3983/Bobra.0365s0055.1
MVHMIAHGPYHQLSFQHQQGYRSILLLNNMNTDQEDGTVSHSSQSTTMSPEVSRVFLQFRLFFTQMKRSIQMLHRSSSHRDINAYKQRSSSAAKRMLELLQPVFKTESVLGAPGTAAGALGSLDGSPATPGETSYYNWIEY